MTTQISNELADLISRHVSEGNIRVSGHPDGPLYIYNYTPRVQYDKLWDEATMMCRGLILDADGRIVARPFPKFFNWGELDESEQIELAQYKPRVKVKYDGSLGIAYPHPVTGQFQIATRGSFVSEQALWANQYVAKMDPVTNYINPGQTLLFEIIYPHNRIVVDYDNWETLVYLATIDNFTGRETLATWVPRWATIGATSDVTFDDLLAGIDADNEEGYVLYWPKLDKRVKVKFAEYVRLHRLVTGTTARTIWESLQTGESLDEILDRVPDEFADWVRDTAANLQAEYRHILIEAYMRYQKLMLETETRKDFAIAAQGYEHRDLLFNILDGRGISDSIWNRLRPAHERPFRKEE